MGSVIITIIYAELQNAWESTAEFVALMLKLSNVTNVKTTTSESRFGWYRQLSGENYYIHICQTAD
ncbi:MAG: hypothetical protein GY820_40205 [Gammaproteobacteria bacterium]|nr:hypothetical protein [Gammaproteobacteria bacterium]